MSGDRDQDYFADGMAEEIITALSRCNWLFVIARNSSFTYKGKAIDVRQVGRELGVRYVMEGSVRCAGNRLRILGQLVDATTGMQIWADRFEGGMTDVFDLQDRITESVVAAIEPWLQLAEIERIKTKAPADLVAYDFLLQALQLEYEFTAASLAAALRCLDRALAIDPFFARALGLAAFCHGNVVSRAGLKTRNLRRPRACGSRNAPWNSQRRIPMFCGWQPMQFANWGWIRSELKKLPTGHSILIRIRLLR